MSSYDDLYKIEVVPGGGLKLYEWDDGVWDPETLDSNETLEAIAGTDRYQLKELYATFIEVKEFAPTADPADDADRFVIVSKSYTDLFGEPIATLDPDDDDDDLYKIEVLPGGGLKLYEWEGGVWDPEDLDGNESLEAIAGTDRYQLKEQYPAFIEVKELAPTPDPVDAADRYVVVAKYYTDLTGARISSPGPEDDDFGGDGDDDCDGDEDDNTLVGYKGDDRLSGYGGKDRLYGDDDDDSLDGGDDDDYLDGGGDDDDLNGGNGDDDLNGGRGDDKANGGNGDDLFTDSAGSGSDHYIGAAGIDTVSYQGAAAGVSVNLLRCKSSSAPGADADVGSDKLQSIENVIGSDFDDVIIGDSRSNDLDGAAGNDSINGLQGLDRYTGGVGADTFVFSKASDTRLGSRADVITDFSSLEGDQIDLRAIDAKKGFTKNDPFVFVEAEPTVAGAGSMGVVWYTGGYLFASTDKDTAAEFAVQVILKDPGALSLSANDILL
jgi:Ca2+-binding RTX toxin-like protein